MLEKRWLVGLAPPVLAVSVAAIITTPPAVQSARHQGLDVAQVTARLELERLAPDVAGRAWLAERGDGRWSYGPAGGGSVRTLPPEETAIAIGRRLVATTVPLPTGKSHLVLREWRTGQISREIDAPMWITTGTFRADDLVVTGYDDAGAAADGGLAVLAERSRSWQVLLPAGPFPAELASASRGDVFISPDARLAASYLCAAEVCDVQVVDLEKARLVHDARQPGFLRTLTDTAMVLTDGELEWISAVDVRSGREIWRVPDSILMNPLAGADGSVVGLVGSNGPGWTIGRIARDGATTDLTPRTRNGSWPQVWSQLSTPRTAVIGRGDLGRALSGELSPAADIVDIARLRTLGRDVLLLPDR